VSRHAPVERLFFALGDGNPHPVLNQTSNADMFNPDRNLFVALSQPHS
jgi:hypothetical protein